MQFIDAIQNRCWAIRQAKLDEINAFIDSRLNGEAIEAAIGKSGNRADQSYDIRDGIAVIPVYGTLEKRMNMLSRMSGGTSFQLIQRDISGALEDPKVDGIVLDVESPGGSVDGTKELADFIFAHRGGKPIVAYANGLMCSAAYWIASACDAIVANDTAIVGSIGVALTHRDTSGSDAAEGVKKTEIYAGKYKRIASSTKPLSEEGREYLQSTVDTYYGIFVNAVAQNRGVSEEKALAMADGREFIGKQALEAGLVDSIGSMDFALDLAKKRSVKRMDLKILQEQHPDLYAQVKAQGAEEVVAATEKAKADAKAEGVKEERARVAEILATDGDPAVIAKCIIDGIPAADAYKALYEAEKNGKAAKLEALKKAAPPSVGQEPSKTDTPAETFESAVEKLVSEGKSKAEAMKTICKTKPALHEAFIKRVNQKGA